MKNIELTIIIPVYNESEIIESVIENWIKTLDEMKIKYLIKIYNDGSTDNTMLKLDKLQKKYLQLIVINQNNIGHGASIFEGYKSATSEWVFQTDSDDEIEILDFNKFWEVRDKYDFVIGYRTERKTRLIRRTISSISNLLTIYLFGAGVTDANCPFRLLKGELIKNAKRLLPEKPLVTNIDLCGFALYNHYNIQQIPVRYNCRKTGKASLQSFKLIVFCINAFIEIIKFGIKLRISELNKINS